MNQAQQAQQAQPLLAETEYQENVTFLAHLHLQAKKEVAMYAQHAQRLQAANESLSKQLKDVQEDLAAARETIASYEAPHVPLIDEVSQAEPLPSINAPEETPELLPVLDA